MASQQVTLVGVAYTDKTGNPPIHLTIVAEMYSTGLSVGGGPMPGGRPPYPDQSLPGNQPYPDQGLPGSQPRPDQSLPGNQPYPDQGLPGDQPGIWGPTDPRPGHPIVIPPARPPVGSAGEDGFIKPPPEEGGWAYHETYGWMYSPSGAGPKSSP